MEIGVCYSTIWLYGDRSMLLQGILYTYVTPQFGYMEIQSIRLDTIHIVTQTCLHVSRILHTYVLECNITGMYTTLCTPRLSFCCIRGTTDMVGVLAEYTPSGIYTNPYRRVQRHAFNRRAKKNFSAVPVYRID